MAESEENSDHGWRSHEGTGPLVATAIHDGHLLRSEVGKQLAISDADRLREEDPFTGLWTKVAPTRVIASSSRFEVDLNRPREKSVYRVPEDSWGLKVWTTPPPDDVVAGSLSKYDAFYASMQTLLAKKVAEHGSFVLFDLHSYNHRRSGPDGEPADPAGNPSVNIGTGTMDRERWGPVVDALIGALRSFDFPGGKLDVRENVKFKGGHWPAWIHQTFPSSGVAIAIEFKKFFMNEWTGKPDDSCIKSIGEALQSTITPVLEARRKVSTVSGTASSNPKPQSDKAGNAKAAAGTKAVKVTEPAKAAKAAEPQRRMKIGFVVNDVMTEAAAFTTTRLCCEATNKGHDVYVFGVGDIAYDRDEQVRARARKAPKSKYGSPETYLKDLQGTKSVRERITVGELDVLMLRNLPSDDYLKRSWAANAASEFGRLAVLQGVVVVNDPSGLVKASTKMYFQLFPSEIRPRTLITRDRNEIKAFALDEGRCVLKPLQGSGGAKVFRVRKSDIPNLNQMIDAVSRDGFVIAQEYLPEAEQGFVRLVLMNGRPLQVKGKYCAFRRLPSDDDDQLAAQAGGSVEAAVVTPAHLRIAEIVRPKLVQDGMFLVGLDLVGDKLLGVNVFSPGGLSSAQKFTKINFSSYVIGALVRKMNYVESYGRNFDNIDICTL